MGLHLLSNAERSVGIFHISNAQSWDTCRGEHVLTMQHLDLLLEGHAANNLVDLLFVTQQLGGIRLGHDGEMSDEQ